MKYVYAAVFTPEEDGGFTVEFPDLRGLITQGDDLCEALFEAQDALSFWLDFLEEEGETIPNPSKLSDIETQGNQFVNLICADTDEKRQAS